MYAPLLVPIATYSFVFFMMIFLRLYTYKIGVVNFWAHSLRWKIMAKSIVYLFIVREKFQLKKS
jgi:hypothetical protein